MSVDRDGGARARVLRSGQPEQIPASRASELVAVRGAEPARPCARADPRESFDMICGHLLVSVRASHLELVLCDMCANMGRPLLAPIFCFASSHEHTTAPPTAPRHLPRPRDAASDALFARHADHLPQVGSNVEARAREVLLLLTFWARQIDLRSGARLRRASHGKGRVNPLFAATYIHAHKTRALLI